MIEPRSSDDRLSWLDAPPYSLAPHVALGDRKTFDGSVMFDESLPLFERLGAASVAVINPCVENKRSWIELSIAPSAGELTCFRERTTQPHVQTLYQNLEQALLFARKFEAARHALQQQGVRPNLCSEGRFWQHIKQFQSDAELHRESILLVDLSTQHILSANSLASVFLGYTPEEFVDLSIFDLLEDENGSVVGFIKRSIQHLLLENHSVVAQQKFRRKHGQSVEAEIQLSLVNFCGNWSLCVVVCDRARRQQGESYLREQEAQFQSVCEALSSVTFICSAEQLRYISPAIEEISGYTRDELMGMNIWDLIEPKELVQIRRLERQQGKPVFLRYELDFVAKDGSERCLEVVATSIKYEGRSAMIGSAIEVSGCRSQS